MDNSNKRNKSGGMGTGVEPTRSRRDERPPLSHNDETGGIRRRVTRSTRHAEDMEHDHNMNNPTIEDVAGPSTSQPTEMDNRINRGKQRIKWTSQMNEDLYRCYLQITLMETNHQPYSLRLYEEITRKHPILLNKTTQNILDQRRLLFTTNRISPEIVQRIREEITMEMQGQTVIDDRNERPADQQSEEQHEEENTDERYARELFERNTILFQGMDPNKRPKLQKAHMRKTTNNNITRVNKIITEKLIECNTIAKVHEIIYVGAATVLDLQGQETRHTPERISTDKQKPKKPWEIRLTTQIENLRKEIAILTQKQNTNQPSRRLERKAIYIINKHKDEENRNLIEVLDLLKQRLSVKSNRLRRYKESGKRRAQNKMFETNQKIFYRTLNKQNMNNQQDQPEIQKEQVMEFWSNIWTTQNEHKTTAKWIKMEKKENEKLKYMTDHKIKIEELKQALRRMSNWRAPGPDGVQNFWLRKFNAVHNKLVDVFNELLEKPYLAPPFFTSGITHLIPKTEPPSPDPSEYRPITCLPTIYKLFTAILTNKIYEHLQLNDIIAEEQKGCRRQSYGCKEQIIIDSIISGESTQNKQDLYWAYIDYKKAFDSVPHSWLSEILSIYKITPQITAVLTTLMSRWQTTLNLNSKEVGDIKVNRGIFQGDSLSALWFCIAMNPLSTMLKRKKLGHVLGKTNVKINHLIYMDDIKIFAKTRTELQQLLKEIETFSNDIGMQFGTNKCNINAIQKGKWLQQEDYVTTDQKNIIQAMDKQETYKYLGVLQAQKTEHKLMKNRLVTEYKTRLKNLLKSKLKSKNLTKAVNAYAVPVISYSFGTIRWTNTDLQDLNRTTRKSFTKYRAHHPHSCTERFHLPRKKGGRGIIDLTRMHHKITNTMREYFYSKSETSQLHQAIIETDRKYTPLNLKDKTYNLGNAITDDEIISQWSKKSLHGRHINTLQQDHIDYQASCQWVKTGSLFPETEGFIMAIQDQVLPTLNYKKYIIKDPTITNDRCRMCHNKSENIEHLISSCPVLAGREYTERHNSVAKIIHNWLAWKIDYYSERTPYYKYIPDQVCETERAKLYWDRTIITDHQIMNNRPDIVLLNKESEICYIVDIAIPSPSNIEEKHKEKITKYTALAAEIKQIWKVKEVHIIPVVLGATGEIPKELHRSLKKLDLPPNLFIEMQKAVILATCNIIRKVFNMGIS